MTFATPPFAGNLRRLMFAGDARLDLRRACRGWVIEGAFVALSEHAAPALHDLVDLGLREAAFVDGGRQRR